MAHAAVGQNLAPNDSPVVLFPQRWISHRLQAAVLKSAIRGPPFARLKFKRAAGPATTCGSINHLPAGQRLRTFKSMVLLYAVARGKKPGIYTTWADARAQVEGVSDAAYKKFDSLEHAQEFMIANREWRRVQMGRRASPLEAATPLHLRQGPTGPSLQTPSSGRSWLEAGLQCLFSVLIVIGSLWISQLILLHE